MRRTKTMLLGDALKSFFERPYVARQIAISKIDEIWREVCGDRVADMTSDLRWENYILHAKIESSLIRHEIFCQREQLKEAINRVAKVVIVNAVIIK